MKKQTLWWIILVIAVLAIAYIAYSMTGGVVSGVDKGATRSCRDEGLDWVGTVYDADRRGFDTMHNVYIEDVSGNVESISNYESTTVLDACKELVNPSTLKVVETEMTDIVKIFTDRTGTPKRAEKSAYPNYCCA